MRKKLLSLILAVSIILPGAAFAEKQTAAFEPGQEYADVEFDADGNIIEKKDEKEETVTDGGLVSYSDLSDMSSAGILSVLDIMGAYEGNSFKPNVYVSRLEFVQALMKLVQLAPEEHDDYGTGIFYDVEKTDDYYADVYTAAMHGIIEDGFDNNTFRPGSVITYDEAVTYVMKALGYDAFYKKTGASLTYTALADEVGLLDKFSVKNHAALMRIEMAKLLANALETPIYNPMFDDTDINSSAKNDENTPLYRYYGIKKADGIVNATRIGSVDLSAASEGNIVVDGRRYSVDTEDFNGFLGIKVTYYYDDDDNMVYMCRHKYVEETVIGDDDVERFDPQTNTLYYSVGNRLKKLKLTNDFTLLYNGQKPETSYSESIFNIRDGRIRIISNDRGGTNSLVLIEEYIDYAVNRVVTEGRDITVGFTDNTGSFTVNVDDTYIELYDVNGARSPVAVVDSKGNDKVQTSGFTAGSVISVYLPWGYTDKSGAIPMPKSGYSYLKIVSCNNKVTGIVNDKDTEEYKMTLGEDEYPVAKVNLFEGAQWANVEYNAEQTFLTDAYGKLVKTAEASSEWSYGFLIKPYFNDDDRLESIKICTSAGKVVKMPSVARLRINGVRIKEYNVSAKLQETAALAGRGFKYSQVIKYKTQPMANTDENGDETDETDVISEIQTITASTGVAPGYSEDTQLTREAYGTYQFMYDGGGHIVDAGGSGSGIIGRYFAPTLTLAVSAKENDEDSAYTIASYKNALNNADLDIYDVTDCLPAFVVHYRQESVDVEIYTGASEGASTPVMFNKSYIALNEDGEAVLKFSVAQQGTVKEYFSRNLNLLNGVECGQLMYLYGTSNRSEEVTSVQLIKSSAGCVAMGIPIAPSRLNDAFDIKSTAMTKVAPVVSSMSTYTIFCEAYSKVSNSNFVIQRGTAGAALRRSEQMVGQVRNAAYQKMGMIAWYENGGKPYCRNATIDDIRFANEYGGKASKIVAFIHEGTARGYAIYNFD